MPRRVHVFLALVALTLAACGGEAQEVGFSEDDSALAPVSCELVRCFAPPQCGPSERAIYTPRDCCGTCVGGGTENVFAQRCAAVMCPAVECPAGEQRVYSPGSCCGQCVPVP